RADLRSGDANPHRAVGPVGRAGRDARDSRPAGLLLGRVARGNTRRPRWASPPPAYYDRLVCDVHFPLRIHQLLWAASGYTQSLRAVSGSMGYGVPAAIAAKLRHPNQVAISFAGDGCFLMYASELATACNLTPR